MLTVNSSISRIEQTANGIAYTVQSHTTQIDTLNGSVGNINSSISQIKQTAQSIESRVSSIENGNYVSYSTLTQTADNIKAEINNGLTTTGIDIANGQITLSATNTVINGNLNLYDSANNGLTIYDDSSVARVNIQSDAIDSISQIYNSDTYTHYTLSASATVSTYNVTSNSQQINWTADTTVDFDKFRVSLYTNDGTNNSYPTAYTSTVILKITQPNGIVYEKTITVYRQDDYGRYVNNDDSVRFTVKYGGIHTVKFQIQNSTSFSGSRTAYFNINSRWQSASSVQTFVGRDGLYSHSGANKLLWVSESETQIRYGFNGIRWNDVSLYRNEGMEVVAQIKGSSPNFKPVWMPFYNYTPMYFVGTGSEHLFSI